MRKLHSLSILSTVAIGAIGAIGASDAVAQTSVADFYKDKSITMYISSGAGGTNDAYARLVAEHISKHIPGNPNVVPKNMPGAGGLKATKFLYKIAPKDGTAMGVVQRAVAVQPLLGIKAADYDPLKFIWVGSTNSEVSMGISWGTSPVKTLKDAMEQELIIGSSGVGNDTGAFPRVLNFFLGTKFKPIHGYQSGTDILLALERQEVMGRVGWSWSSLKSRKPKWIKDGTINLLVQMGLKKAKDNPDTPLALDFAKTPKDRKAMELIFSATTIGWPSLLPPGVPKDRADAIRAAYKATMKDKPFLKGAKKRRLGVDPVTGEEIEAIIARIYAFPPDIVERAKEAYKPRGKLLKVKLMTAKGTISKINKKGSKFTLASGAKSVKARVSRRSKIKIAGKKAKRKNLKKGMVCEITLAASGAVAQKVNCN